MAGSADACLSDNDAADSNAADSNAGGNFRMALTKDNLLEWGKNFIQAGMLQMGFTNEMAQEGGLEFKATGANLGGYQLYCHLIASVERCEHPMLARSFEAVFEQDWGSFWESHPWDAEPARPRRRRIKWAK